MIIEFISIATTCSFAVGDSLNKIKMTKSESRKIGHQTAHEPIFCNFSKVSDLVGLRD